MSYAMTAVAIGAGIKGGTGIAQLLASGKRKKERELEAQTANMPKYAGSQSLDQYYQQALQQANTAAAQSAMYKQGQNLANRNLAQGLSLVQTGNIGQGGVSKLVQGANDATMRNLTQAEAQKEQRFGRLGQAAQMKSAEDFRKFQINQQQPWETKYNLLASRAAAAAQQQQAGFQNLSGAGTDVATGLLYKNKKTKGGNTTQDNSGGYDYDNRI
jgi:hypothetical protein